MKYLFHVDAVIAASSYGEALRLIGEHFQAWASDTPLDDPDSWTTDASLFAPQFEAGSVVHLMPEDDSHA